MSAREEQPLAQLHVARFVVALPPAFLVDLEAQRARLGRVSDCSPESVMIDEAYPFYRVRRDDLAVVNRDQIVAILLLAKLGQVRRTREQNRIAVVVINNDELVMHFVSETCGILFGERLGNELVEHFGLDQDAAGLIGLVIDHITRFVFPTFVISYAIR